HLLGLLALASLFALLDGLFMLQTAQIPLVGGHGQTAGDQEVASVALLHLDDVALFTQGLHILRENHFQGRAPPTKMQALFNPRRAGADSLPCLRARETQPASCRTVRERQTARTRQ